MGAKVVAGVDDLFFSAKIAETARHLGVPVALVSRFDEVLPRIRQERPALVVFDLNSRRCRPLEMIRALKADPDLKGIPILGFLSHVQTDLKKEAAAAGCDTILPRSAFSERLPELLKPFAPPADAAPTA